jgi:hypothetical protein
MKSNAVNAGSVNWIKLRNEAFTKAKTITDPYQMGPVIRHLYQSLNDYHGFFRYGDSTFRWKPNKRSIPDSVMNEWKKGTGISATVLEDNIGYLRVPGIQYGGKEGDSKNAQKLNDSLCYLFGKNIKGLVLDLRLNGGGSMFPMILGLQQLFLPGKIGHFITKRRINWYIKENSFLLDSVEMASISPKCGNNLSKFATCCFNRGGNSQFGGVFSYSPEARKRPFL